MLEFFRKSEKLIDTHFLKFPNSKLVFLIVIFGFGFHQGFVAGGIKICTLKCFIFQI